MVSNRHGSILSCRIVFNSLRKFKKSFQKLFSSKHSTSLKEFLLYKLDETNYPSNNFKYSSSVSVFKKQSKSNS